MVSIQQSKNKKEDKKINKENKTGKENKDSATNEDNVKYNMPNLNKNNCDYHCKRKSTLQKHMKSNHTKEPSCDIIKNAFKCNKFIIMHKDPEEKVKKNRFCV